MIDYWTISRGPAVHRPRMNRIGRHSDLHSYMAFTDAPHPSNHLLPGMYEFNEEVVCRRHASGNISWNWNVGLASPQLPAQNTPAR